jgi:hypothetical protein
MGLTDPMGRLVGGDDEEPGPAYETKRSVCVDCNGHVREAPAG